MNRREFTKSLAATAALTGVSSQAIGETASDTTSGSQPFKAMFSPHFGMCKPAVGNDLIKQLNYMYDQGFRGWEDNRMPKRPVEEQNKIAKEMERLGMTMGVFVAWGDFKNPVMSGYRLDVTKRKRDKEAVLAMLKKTMHETVELAKRVNAKWVTVVPGAWDQSLEEGYQFANVVECLKYCAEICEKGNVVMVLEPLNHMNHPGLYLSKIPQAYAVCQAVGSPSCKILNDLYHQQITEGNLIPNIDRAWDEIAYIQIGDNPGRKEPTTGEINFQKVFQHIWDKGYRGVFGMEHGVSQPDVKGVKRLIEAYREVDVV